MDYDVLDNYPNLTPEAICIYTCLATFADKNREAYPTVNTLVRLSHMTETRFYKHMKILEHEGIVIKTSKKDGNLKRGTIYKLQDFRNPTK